MQKVLIAMSGGVDSSVAALLLKQAGYDVHGAYIKTWLNEDTNPIFADCPWTQELDDAKVVADMLAIPFEVVNCIQDYKQKVVDYLVDGYRRGITPNPDLMCNREIKFGFFLEHAKKRGFDYVATGHYARKMQYGNLFELYEGVDKNKDQSYFLALLNQDQLSRSLFPLGELTKPQVRTIAEKYNLPTAHKKDSQGICFLGKISINNFLSQFISDKSGNIVNTKGEFLGKHKGLHHYTLGQRKGIGIPSNKDFEKYVVVAKDYKNNELILAFESPNAPGLYSKQARIRELHFIGSIINQPQKLLAKPRYRDLSQVIQFTPIDKGLAEIEFENEQRALTPGQLLALYDGERLLGGGFYY